MINKIKRIIFLLIILIIIILIIIVILKKNKKNIISEIEYIEEAYSFDPNIIRIAESRSDYIIIEKCIRKYYLNLQNGEYINSLLAKDYLELFNLNVDKDLESINYYNNFIVDIPNIYIAQIGTGVNIYFANGYLINTSSKEKEQFEIGVILDSHNQTFAIIPQEYLKEIGYSKLNDKSNIQIKTIEEIENKKNNVYKYKYIDDDTYMEHLFDNYINRCIFNVELAYESLEDAYKSKKFANIEEYKEYLDKNKQKYDNYYMNYYMEDSDVIQNNNFQGSIINTFRLRSYMKNIYNKYTQYTLIDNYNNYYIFRETAPMNYSLILDTYTIDIPEFVEKYEEGNSQIKTALNIQKIVDALNDEDYKYVYGKLAEDFKQNNFKTLEDFEQYATNTFGKNNKVTYDTFIETSNYCTYDITLKRGENEVKKTIIMKLQEGIDFVFSFNVD